MPDMLLKLLVKDKLLHSRKVPVNAKERQLRPQGDKITADEYQPAQERLAGEAPEEREMR